jgi:hypothetical protein
LWLELYSVGWLDDSELWIGRMYILAWFKALSRLSEGMRKNMKNCCQNSQRRLVVGLSPRRRGFDAGSVYVGFVVDKVVLGQVFLRVLRFSPVNFIPPVLHYTEKRKSSNYLHHRVAQ